MAAKYNLSILTVIWKMFSRERTQRKCVIGVFMCMTLLWFIYEYVTLRTVGRMKPLQDLHLSEKSAALDSISKEKFRNEEEESNYMSEFLHINVRCEKWAQQHSIVLNNTGVRNILLGRWSLFFTNIEAREGVYQTQPVDSCPIEISHVNGRFHRLDIKPCVKELSAGKLMVFDLDGFNFASYAQLYNGWYVAFDDGRTTKRLKYRIDYSGDNFRPESRFDWSFVLDQGSDLNRILPSPKSTHLTHDEPIDISGWVVCTESEIFKKNIQTFTDIFSLQSQFGSCPDENAIHFIRSWIRQPNEEDEYYRINLKQNEIEIIAASDRGGFYAIQTLRSLAEATEDGSLGYYLPTGTIEDEPRFSYRSVMIDPARNFIPKNHVISLIETMGMYKLNKLHFHLTDDEGWRLAIPGLPELTSIGGSRCHNGHECLYPQLGSGPNRLSLGSGFYTISDYEDILRVAEANKVEVIPEIDVPGHSNAAIKAMAQRFKKYAGTSDDAKGEEFLLRTENMGSSSSGQFFGDNVLEPCIESTYRFIDHVVGEVVKIHSRVQPLRKIHLGGDEVPHVEYSYDMKSCQNNPLTGINSTSDTHKHLLRYFYEKVIRSISSKHHIDVVTWQECSELLTKPVDDTEMFVNVWKKSDKELASDLANNGFKVVLSTAESLYLDIRQEPDVSEVGLAWSSPYINDQTVFGFTPDEFYLDDGLVSSHRSNIVGMQAHLWGELITSVDIFQSQLYPRLLSFAERAWSKADWESPKMTQVASYNLQKKDWESFANMIGYKELKRLTMREINYRIPPPGVREIEEILYANTMYPGFVIMYQVQCTEKETTIPCMWRIYDESNPPKRTVDYDSDSRIKFVTVDGPRRSREIEFTIFLDFAFGPV